MARRWIKRIAVFLAAILCLVITLILLLHSPWGKTFVTNQVERYLHKKFNSTVSIGSIDYRLPDWIKLNDVLVLDHRNDTLLNSSFIYARINMLKLVSQKVEIGAIELKKTTLHINRLAGDSLFNFQFILDAFAGSSSEPDTIVSSSAPMHLSVDHVLLEKIYVTFNDKKEKQFFSAWLGYLHCTPDDLDPTTSSFRIKQLVTAGNRILLIDSSEASLPSAPVTPEKKPASQSSPFYFVLDKLSVSNIGFSYKKPADKIDFNVQLDTLQLDHASIDAGKQLVKGGLLTLQNSSVSYTAWLPPDKEVIGKTNEPPPENERPPEKNWKIAVTSISLNNNSFSYNNEAMPRVKGFDYNHLQAKRIHLATSQSSFDGNSLETALDSLSFVVNDQFDLRALRSSVLYTDSLLSLKDLSFGFNQSRLQTTGELAWPLKQLTAQTTQRFNCRIAPSSISVADILLLQPGLMHTLPVSLAPSDQLILSGNITGSLQNFQAKGFSLRTNSQLFQWSGDAGFRAGDAKNEMSYTADIAQLKVSKKILSPSLLHDLEKQKITLPSTIVVTGTVKGSSNDIATDLSLVSDFGKLQLNGQASHFTAPQLLEYDYQLAASGLETGKWIGQDSLLGKLNGIISLKGKGLQPKKMQAGGKLQVETFQFNGYNYSNIGMEYDLDSSAFTANGRIDDPNLATTLHLRGTISGAFPAINGDLKIEKADLHQMHFTSDTLVLSSLLSITTENTNDNNYAVTLRADSNRLLVHNKEINVDSLLVTAHSGKDSGQLQINAPFLNAGLRANQSLARLPDIFNHIQRRLFTMGQLHSTMAGNPIIEFNASIIPHDLLSTIAPGLELKQALTLHGRYYDEKKDSFLYLRALAPAIRYNKMLANDLMIEVENQDSAVSFSIGAASILSGTDSFLHPGITGRLQNDLLTVSARIGDHLGKEYYAVNASMQAVGNSKVFRLMDDVTIDHVKWKVPADNRVVMVKDGLMIQNLSVTNSGQTISVKTRDPQAISPVEIRIDSIDIGKLMAVASLQDTAMAAGTINAAISIEQPIHKFPVFTGNIAIRHIGVQGVPVGDLQFYSSTKGDSLLLNGNLAGNNQFDFSGGIHPLKGGINATANLRKLDMKLVQQFTKAYIDRASGQVTSQLILSGTTSEPLLKGSVHFDSTTFALKGFDALYRIHQQQVTVDYPRLNFDRFILSDTLGNQLSVNGTFNFLNLTEYGLDLRAQTKNFIALNAPRTPESMVYGKAIINADIKIKGTSGAPDIEGNAFLHDKSSIHYVLSQTSDYTKKGKDGIRFVDLDTLLTLEEEKIQLAKDTLARKGKFRGSMKYNLNLEISKNAEFSIIIDPSTNDELVIKGEAHLNTGLGESGKMGLTGVYELHSGYYNMNNQFLKGKFMLVKGSTITFNGDPYNAVADVETQYEVQTSSSGLLNTNESETPGVSKRLPYLVIFTIKGPISKPDLSFDIRLKDNTPGLNSSLKSDIDGALEKLRKDVSALNKQVFSLLVVNRFTISGQGDGNSAFNADEAVKEGMSKFLSEAMNQVAADLIKGVDIDVNLKNYKTDSDNSKTDLGVSMSKDLFRDRLSVSIGKNFSLGEDTHANNQFQNDAAQYMPDITTTYKLSKDGRYLVKAYRKNEYDAVVEGYFAETGVSFTIELDYNKFKELFYSSRKIQNQ